MNKPNSLLTIILLFFLISAQNTSSIFSKNSIAELNTSRPKLVIGIVIDQMRYDYLTRFEERYGEGGFNRLINEGFNCKNNHFNYIPTFTGPGHASIYSGTTPKYHGIISNHWYDKVLDKTVYCAGDDSVRSIGTENPAGKMSPHRMVVTTFADENRLFTQMKGKSIGISIKDRGAILPAGHTANAAYWFHGENEGNWVSSSYYMEELPAWVTNYNQSNAVEKYLKPWNTLYDISTYNESGPDLNEFEGGFNGKETATFPYDIQSLSPENGGLDILKVTPFGNNMVTDFALEVLKQEELGIDNITDVLTISYSSTDYIGHNFGVNSKEIEDTYLRLDNEIERLLNELDRQVGAGNYTVFLTSDHGVVDVPSYLQSIKIPAGYINNTTLRQNFNFFLLKKYGTSDIVANVSNNQIFLDRKKIEELNLSISEVEQAIINEIITYDSVDKVYTGTTMNNNVFSEGIEVLLQNGYNQKRSGDILYVNTPATISYGRTGSTHGSGLNYDTHVPLIFYGYGIKQGSTLRKTRVVDIAPTISALLGIGFPNSSTGIPLKEVLD